MNNVPLKANKGLTNHEIVTLAVYLLGGDTQYIDTEDVAVKANEIAPGRFTWRKYSRQINIENVRTFGQFCSLGSTVDSPHFRFGKPRRSQTIWLGTVEVFALTGHPKA